MDTPAFVFTATPTNARPILSARPFLSGRAAAAVRSPLLPSTRRATFPAIWTCTAAEAAEAAPIPEAEEPAPVEEAAPTPASDDVEAAASEDVEAAASEDVEAAASEAPIAAQQPVEQADPEPAPVVAEQSDPAADPEEQTEKRKRRRTRPKKEITVPWEDITIGMQLEGVVRSVAPYGAFITDLGTPTDGLLHVSELAAGYVDSVTDIVNVGDKLTVRVMAIDMVKKNISLTIRTPEQLAEKQSGRGGRQKAANNREEQNKKWEEFTFDPAVYLDAKVVSIAEFGAFCKLINEEGESLESAPTDGLVHISELSSERVSNVSDILQVGQAIKVRIAGTDRKRNRISMSLKPYNPEEEDGSSSLAADLAASASNQPEFKTSFELAFERANARANK